MMLVVDADRRADLATIVRCISSAADETLCAESPSCDECGLRRLLHDTLERGTVSTRRNSCTCRCRPTMARKRFA